MYSRRNADKHKLSNQNTESRAELDEDCRRKQESKRFGVITRLERHNVRLRHTSLNFTSSTLETSGTRCALNTKVEDAGPCNKENVCICLK
jgi:hypothetical protein